MMPIFRRRLISADYRDAMLSTNPVAYWRLGERSGTVARDEMGANHGTYVNTPALGAAGLLTGDGDPAVTVASASSQYISVGAAASLALGDTFCYAVWLSVTNLTDYHVLWSRSGVGGAAIYVTPGGDVNLDAALVGNIFSALGKIAVGPRYMVVVAKAGSAVRLYINGLDVTPAITNRTIVDSAAIPARIGADFNFSLFASASLDEAAVWNRALTADEIAWLYRVGTGR